MALPRSKYVQEGQEGVYHCFSRCVRRAFLYGFDALTRRDYSHRKAWLVDRLRSLAAIFAVEVCSYSVMQNHYHVVLRTRPDLVASWPDWEVARRWLTLCPGRRSFKATSGIPTDEQIRTLADRSARIAQLRKRLSSLSWFMGRLNEFIARAANKEDDVTGRFWEGRFKCQALLDEAAIASCMVYVDLNPIRAGAAATPETSDFTSIQERIRAWQREALTPDALQGQEEAKTMHTPSAGSPALAALNNAITPDPVPDSIPDLKNDRSFWLCPIHSEADRRGILAMTEAEYIDLVDRSGRMMRADKRGAIDADLAPILVRIGANPNAWFDTVSRFGSRFRLAAGFVSSLRAFADRLGKRWLQGLATARAAYTSPQPSLA